MKKTLFSLVSLILCLFLSTESKAQKPKSKKLFDKTTNFEIGIGVMGSVLYLSRNIKENNDARGYSITGNYGGHKLLRFGFQYTYYQPINIEPTWYNIKAHTLEGNLELIARFRNNKTYLYPFFGLSYNTFKGYFTGENDFLGLREYYRPYTTHINNWVGFNIGTGFEHSFGPVVLFADYLMRIGKQGEKGTKGGGINIMDVCYGAGVRFKIAVPTFRKIYRGLNDKYSWF